MTKYEHLRLQIIPQDFIRKKRAGGGYKIVHRDRDKFTEPIIQEFTNMNKKIKEERAKYKGYLDPNLIFKININQNVAEEGFREELKRMNIEVISPSPDKKGYWVVFSEDEEFKVFKRKLEGYLKLEKKYDFFNAIDSISDIPPEEKIGFYLSEEPFKENSVTFLDIEIWRMEDIKLFNFLRGFEKLIEEKGGRITDRLTRKNFCLLRVKVNYLLYKEILNLREIAHVDRPPKVNIEAALSTDLKALKIEGKPSEDSPGILVIDSGILPGHPLLENAVGNAIAIETIHSKEVKEDRPYDDIGHGTKVAGIALYGDINECIKIGNFRPEIWIFSAKVMFKGEDGQAIFDEEELLEHQLLEAINRIIEDNPKCKIINLSFGNSKKRLYKGHRQFNLAALIDELSKELNLIFIVSAGNFDYESLDIYPDYLLDDSTNRVKIIDPATSALCLTVGSLYKNIEPSSETLISNELLYPSPLTRIGPGYKDMIKPELSEIGGSSFREESRVVTLNPNWVEEGRLFTLDCGTSFSAPKVAHHIAKLIQKYPSFSNNLIKSLIISSASIPKEKPPTISDIDISKNDSELMKILNIYGFGVPNLERALYSEENRVILLRENTIELDKFHIYTIDLPENFIEEKGDRSITITLVFDPPVNKNRTDYLGVYFETHLFKNVLIGDVIDKYKKVTTENHPEIDEIVPKELRNSEIKLNPGVTIRKRGVHQQGTITFKKRPQIESKNPLILVVVCQNRWIKEKDYTQNYAVLVSIEHSQIIDLYNQIKVKIRERIKV